MTELVGGFFPSLLVQDLLDGIKDVTCAIRSFYVCLTLIFSNFSNNLSKLNLRFLIGLLDVFNL
ncbi:hypothetical protein [Mycobacterium paragordonae]|uniref:Uncharacterized protein n=1 Tax=Mycobacterium paragordonae TaxID=1389713 RepID=A0A4R5W8P9_9MYCO|nr:hypothetical protein [Mycobacterium paragordonae]MDP7734528.1 hypothetical protein [Mycobacterium paragordonae]TDK85097.1 hypothetical protein EI067_31575 [Mycobacterium paragordonae]TDK85338.1 hypothetical protein EUA02_30120 [Mycobacterium paragordonae]TDK98632.1 hypothetical protein EUA05_31290 [Mycobacterium paragordonae]